VPLWRRDQERSKVGVTSLADPEQPRLPARRMLAGYEPEPGSEISRFIKRLSPPDSGDERRCVEGADAGDRCQASGHIVRASELGKLQVEGIDAAVKGSPFRAHVDKEFAESTRSKQGFVSQHLVERLLELAAPLSDDGAALEKHGAHLVDQRRARPHQS
jgi:hypothetical protein